MTAGHSDEPENGPQLTRVQANSAVFLTAPAAAQPELSGNGGADVTNPVKRTAKRRKPDGD
nr:MAG TPA: hypothetical protein [Caudoviricetes sp.]